MDGNLSDALNDGLWFGLRHPAIYCRLNLQAFALVNYTGLSNALRDELIKDIQSFNSWSSPYSIRHWPQSY